MSDVKSKEAIFKKFQDRQADRRADMLAERQAETEAAVAGADVETRMTIEEGLAFLTAGGEREDAA